MLIKHIVAGVNHKLSGEMLSFRDLVPHLDSVIDDINQQLNTCFPAFSKLPDNTVTYDCIPDRYIRSCVIVGAAYYFYMTDEEGSVATNGYQATYAQNLFYMLRDYIHCVPEKYKACNYQGTVPFDLANGSHIKFGCLSGCGIGDGFPSPAAVAPVPPVPPPPLAPPKPVPTPPPNSGEESDCDCGCDFTVDDTLTYTNGELGVNVTQEVATDNTLPIASSAVARSVGNINTLLETI